MRVKIACNITTYYRGCILLGKRKSGAFDGMWCLPGGHANFGESIYRCAKRELFEETGLIHVPLNLFFIMEEIKKTEHYYHFFFYAILRKNKLIVKNGELDKFKEWCYFKINDFPKAVILSHRQAINNFIKIYRKHRRSENFGSKNSLKDKLVFSGID